MCSPSGDLYCALVKFAVYVFVVYYTVCGGRCQAFFDFVFRLLFSGLLFTASPLTATYVHIQQNSIVLKRAKYAHFGTCCLVGFVHNALFLDISGEIYYDRNGVKRLLLLLD